MADIPQNTTSVYSIPRLGGSVATSPHWNYESEDFTNLSSSEILLIINAKEAELLTPIIAFLSLLMFTGFIVNSIVLYIYKFKFKRSNPRAFILCLAVLDMVSCCVGMPYHIADMLYPYMFYAVVACQILTFILTFTSVASTLILVLIAIERFLKICKPFESQISVRGSKIACWIVMAVALFLSWPSAVINGFSTQDLGVANVTGVLCYIEDDLKETIFPVLYESLLFFVFAGGTITLLVLYTIVGRRVLQHGGFRIEAAKKENIETKKYSCMLCSTFTDSTGESEVSVSDEHKDPASSTFLPHEVNTSLKKDKGKKKFQRAASAPADHYSPQPSIMGRIRAFTFTAGDGTLRRHKEEQSFRKAVGSVSSSNSAKDRRTKRITVMLLLITAIYVISFLPHLTVSVIASLDEEFWQNLSQTETVIYEFFLRMYFINNVANFFIYGLWDAKFRRECKLLLQKIFNCTCNK